MGTSKAACPVLNPKFLVLVKPFALVLSQPPKHSCIKPSSMEAPGAAVHHCSCDLNEIFEESSLVREVKFHRQSKSRVHVLAL